ncbi:hypothetical protein [Sulfuricystis multivorans]|uniref:hypothetical protein n=1 Tax=Sulfuricystis multivorans TaxID=2211108 RepID=UPI000F8282C8|nr:hypothetical protein [Sulfuricystis multivorans]
MAIRLKTKFHTPGQRSPATLASVVAVLAWKLAIESIKRMRKADYDIDPGRPYFDFVCEYLAFLAVAADRVAHRKLDAAARNEFTSALVKNIARFVEENNIMLLGEAVPGESQRHFIDLFNRRVVDYAEFDYTEQGPDFAFKRFFAACLRDVLPEKDKLWVIDQAMDIEAPESLKMLEKTLDGLFNPEQAKSQRRQDLRGSID